MNIYALLRVDDSEWEPVAHQRYGLVRYKLERVGEKLNWVPKQRVGGEFYFQYAGSYQELKERIEYNIKDLPILPHVYIRQTASSHFPNFIYRDGDFDRFIRLEDI